MIFLIQSVKRSLRNVSVHSDFILLQKSRLLIRNFKKKHAIGLHAIFFKTFFNENHSILPRLGIFTVWFIFDNFRSRLLRSSILQCSDFPRRFVNSLGRHQPLPSVSRPSNRSSNHLLVYALDFLWKWILVSPNVTSLWFSCPAVNRCVRVFRLPINIFTVCVQYQRRAQFRTPDRRMSANKSFLFNSLPFLLVNRYFTSADVLRIPHIFIPTCNFFPARMQKYNGWGEINCLPVTWNFIIQRSSFDKVCV